jgi:hypothetical protein
LVEGADRDRVTKMLVGSSAEELEWLWSVVADRVAKGEALAKRLPGE